MIFVRATDCGASELDYCILEMCHVVGVGIQNAILTFRVVR